MMHCLDYAKRFSQTFDAYVHLYPGTQFTDACGRVCVKERVANEWKIARKRREAVGL